MGRYDVAQICVEGHITNDHAQSVPDRNRRHCTKCGAETITACASCSAPIRGAYQTRGTPAQMSGVPAFCHECGEPYPWTGSKLEAARDLVDQLGLDIPERALLETSIEELIRNTPRAPAEAVRFKAIVETAQPWALGAFKEVLFGVVGEAAKKLIWP
jgi:hypothetical protein